jgi:metal-sulfur cluster biosynthetic enzyme
MWTAEEILEVLKPICDPELGISVVDLGLIYDIQVDGPNVKIQMTLTSPICPWGPELLDQVKQTVESLPFVQKAEIELVWSPPWDPRTMASEEAKMLLGIF